MGKLAIVVKILKYRIGDVIELKKAHPCSSKQFKILRVGGNMRILCLACGRDMNIDRLKLEKATKKVLYSQDTEKEGEEKQ